MRQRCSIIFLALFPICASASPVRVGPVVADLVSSVQSISPGTPFVVAFRMTLDKPWHAYWINPGDSGLAPTLDWTLPNGFVAGELQHPAPIAISTPPFMTYGHEGDILFLVEITPPRHLPQATVTLSAAAEWLICDDLCVPGAAELELVLPVLEGPAQPHPVHAPLIESARGQLPAEPAGWHFRAQKNAERVELFVAPPAGLAEPWDSATFFPYSSEAIVHAAPQPFRRTETGFVLELVPSDPSDPRSAPLAGVLVLRRGTSRLSLRIEAPFSEPIPARYSNPERNPP